MRKEVEKFSQRMEFTLQENDDKVHWSNLSQNLLENQASKVAEKLQNAVCANNHGKVIKHAVDLANYCMMLADNATRNMERTY